MFKILVIGACDVQEHSTVLTLLFKIFVYEQALFKITGKEHWSHKRFCSRRLHQKCTFSEQLPHLLLLGLKMPVGNWVLEAAFAPLKELLLANHFLEALSHSPFTRA
jgi:hypothetical protein